MNVRMLLTHRLPATLTILALLAGAAPFADTADAATQDAILHLRPHCEELGGAGTDMFGEVEIDALINLAEDTCPHYQAESPTTAVTDPLQTGDTLDMDLILENPGLQPVSRVRAWLNYDPEILEGLSIEAEDTLFPMTAPGEGDFSPTEGFAKIDVSTAEGSPVKAPLAVVARIRFTVKKTSSLNRTPITFYNVQTTGNTFVMAGEDDILTPDLVQLDVVFGEAATGEASALTLLSDGVPCEASSDCESGYCINGMCGLPVTLSSVSSVSSATSESASSVSSMESSVSSSVSSIPLPPYPNGSACTAGTECQSGYCADGLCLPPLSSAASSSVAPDTSRTAFALLQIQRLMLGTEGDAVFLAWDPLASSQLKAYNIYYGTTAGRYIQRKTVEGTAQSTTIRGLPAGTHYFFAIRAVSTGDEESAFSPEASVVVGQSQTTTSPLAGSVGGQPLPPGLAGRTGAPSTLAFFLLLSAGIGTLLACRRQFLVTPARDA